MDEEASKQRCSEVVESDCHLPFRSQYSVCSKGTYQTESHVYHTGNSSEACGSTWVTVEGILGVLPLTFLGSAFLAVCPSHGRLTMG